MNDKRVLLDGLALGAGTGLYLGLYAARVHTSHVTTFGFLAFNLALAWAPWCFAVALARWGSRSRLLAGGLLVAWLLMLPNAPYLLTDFVHLRARAPIPLYYDILLLGAAALTGMLSGAFSLRLVQPFCERAWGPARSWLLVSFSIVASGFGIYLGRFERWNSWDALLHPVSLARSLGDLPWTRVLVVTVAASALLAIVFVAVRPAPEATRPSRAPL